jgi:methionine-rich copper-binding protein CopC
MPTYSGTANNDSWTVVNPGTFTLDGLGGTDTLYLGTSLRSQYTITKAGDGSVHIDSVSGASAALHATLFNMETLVFNNKKDTLDLATYFGDSTPPTVSAVSPANQSTGAAVGANIVVTFSETIQRGSGTITLKDGAGTVVASYDAATSGNVSVSGNTLTINPSADLANGTSYTITLAAGSVKDAAGNALATTNSYGFTTVAAPTSFTGTAGNDTVNAPSTTVSFDGLAGIDTVNFSKAASAYTITHTATGYTVSDGVAVGQLTHVERLVFADGTKLALDLDGHAGQTAKILGAVFGAAAVGNKAYAGIGLDLLDGGMSYAKLMQAALDAALGPNASHKAVVGLLYTNVVGVAPSAADEAYYVGLLDNGSISPAALGIAAADLDLNAAHINLVGLAATGLAFS